jgi:cobalt transporter subunit CbtB
VAKEVSLNTQSNTVVTSSAQEKSERIKAAMMAFALGAGLVLTAGFAHSDTIHNAGHDTRHALSFPCH